MRLRRRGVAVTARGLTFGQKFDLLYGIGCCEPGFRDRGQYEEAWRRHREDLLAECAPFCRPDAYWEVDVGYQPACQANGYESEKSALLRLGLPLTATEKRMLSSQKLQAPAS